MTNQTADSLSCVFPMHPNKQIYDATEPVEVAMATKGQPPKFLPFGPAMGYAQVGRSVD